LEQADRDALVFLTAHAVSRLHRLGFDPEFVEADGPEIDDEELA